MLSVKKFFDPLDGEDNFYRVDSDLNKKYEILESIYNKLYSNKTTQEAKDISLYIRDKNQYVDKSLTYGEVTFRSLAYIFEYCKSRFDMHEEGNFVDLGSGIGCAVIGAVLCSCFKKYIGVEFIPPLNEKANLFKQKFMEMFLDINKEYNDYLPDYIFDENLKNEIVFETEKNDEEKKEEVEGKEEAKEEEEEEEETEEKHDINEDLKKYMMSGKNDGQNILDIIYGKKDDNDNEGYLSYAKKSQLRNKLFLEEYDRKQKLLAKKNDTLETNEEKNKIQGNKKLIHDLIHGAGGFLEKLETHVEDKNSESEKDDKISKKSGKKSSKLVNNENKDDKMSTSNKSKSLSSSKRIITPYIEFNCGNFLKMDLTESSFIFCNSTCFSSELFLQISQKVSKEAPTGCIVVTFTKKLPFLNSNEWDIKKGFKKLMSWGIATVFVHRRIKSMNNTKTSKSKSSHSDKNNDSLYSSKTSSHSSRSRTSNSNT